MNFNFILIYKYNFIFEEYDSFYIVKIVYTDSLFNFSFYSIYLLI